MPAPSAIRTGGRSMCGSAWARCPPRVATLRTRTLDNVRNARTMTGAWLRTRGERSSADRVAMAPIRSSPFAPASIAKCRCSTARRLMSRAGWNTPIFIISITAVPPAIARAESVSSSAAASRSVLGSTSSKGVIRYYFRLWNGYNCLALYREQSGKVNAMTSLPFDMSLVQRGARLRRTPFFEATQRHGAKAYTVYNHMFFPVCFADLEEEYWHLINHVTLWDVSVERQVEITGRDAAAFTDMLTPRDLSRCAVGQGKYVVITGQDGGIINDPVLLRLGKNHFWLALADSDVLLWAQGVAVHSGMKVEITEPDVSPLQIQGPKAKDVVESLFGDRVLKLRYYHFLETTLDGIPVVVTRTGWTGEIGYEIYLRDGSRG